jgi:hypothetical protein
MRNAEQLIDAVQTTGIIVIAAALIYVVIRLERQFRCWAETLASVNKQLREQATAIREQAAVADTLMSERIEARIDGEALLRALLAYKRAEPRVCAMAKAPTPEEEDRRRLCRERNVLIAERVKHVNRVKGLLFSQGISGYEPLRRDRRQRLDELTTGDGRPFWPKPRRPAASIVGTSLRGHAPAA